MYYVYELIDPRNGAPFYVGKGKGRRAHTHLWAIPDTRNVYKESKIAAIRREGLEPIIKYVVENVENEQTAYELEAELIKKYGRKGYEKDGILTNICVDARPPNHGGRTYEQIYGPEKAQQQKIMRAQLQRDRGGYGPKKHSEETRALLSDMRKGENNPNFGKHHSTETIAKMKASRKPKHGKIHHLSYIYKLVNTATNITYILYGGEMDKFCKQHNLSRETFKRNLSDGWPPSKRGKNVGWQITVIQESEVPQFSESVKGFDVHYPTTQ